MRARKARPDGEEACRLLREMNPCPIWMLDLKTLKFLAVNEAAIRCSGYSRREFRKMTVHDLGPGAEIHGFVEALARYPPRRYEGRWRHRTKDGAILDVAIAARAVPYGGHPACLVRLTDLGQRRRDEERGGKNRIQRAAKAQQRAEAKYRSIFENAAEGICQSTSDGRILTANPAMARMLGYESPKDLMADVTDMGSHLYADPKRRDEIKRILEKYGSVTGFEARFLRKDGEPLWVSINSRAVRDQAGSFLYYEGTMVDITDRWRAEESLREVSGRLLRSQSDERRRIARELHDSTAQGLAALAMNLALIGRAAKGLDEVARKRLTDSLELTQQACREIRTLAYLLHPPDLEETDLRSTVRAYAEGFTRRSGVRVEMATARKIGRLPGEVSTALLRIVQESLANIHRHSGSRRARIRLARSAAGVTLVVSDQGRGIRAGLDRKAGEPAELGVGIAGMRERVRQLGGRISIDSIPRGTRVRVTLPLPRSH